MINGIKNWKNNGKNLLENSYQKILLFYDLQQPNEIEVDTLNFSF